MLGAKGYHKDNIFESDKAIFKYSSIEFDTVFIEINGKRHKKLSYYIHLE